MFAQAPQDFFALTLAPKEEIFLVRLERSKTGKWVQT